MTSRQILTRAATVGFLAPFVLAFLPLDPVLYTARALALAAVVHLIWRYHRLADWSTVEIGRSTMAIKGAILVLAVAANLRSVDDLSLLSTRTALSVALEQGWLHGLAEVGIVAGWLALSAALLHRDRLVVKMQGEAHALPAPPPANYLPSEEIKDERT